MEWSGWCEGEEGSSEGTTCEGAKNSNSITVQCCSGASSTSTVCGRLVRSAMVTGQILDVDDLAAHGLIILLWIIPG